MPTEDNIISGRFDVKEILFGLLRRWYILCGVLAVCIISSLIYSTFIVTPLYSSNGKIYIMNKESQNINTSDISVSSYLTRDYENLIVDKAVLGEVAERLDYKYSYGRLRGMVTVENPENTRFLEISVMSPNASDSKKIVDLICEVSQEKIIELLGIDRVNIVRKGDLSKRPVVPNTMRNLYMATIVGLVGFVAVFLAIYFLDDKINSPEDVEKYLEISVLGDISYIQSKKK